MAFTPTNVGDPTSPHLEDNFVDGIDDVNSWEFTGLAPVNGADFIGLNMPNATDSGAFTCVRSRQALSGSGRLRMVLNLQNNKPTAGVTAFFGLSNLEDESNGRNIGLVVRSAVGSGNNFGYRVSAQGTSVSRNSGYLAAASGYTANTPIEIEIIRRRGSVTMGFRNAAANGTSGRFTHIVTYSRNNPSLLDALRVCVRITSNAVTNGAFGVQIMEVRWIPEASLSQPLSVTYDADTVSNGEYQTTQVSGTLTVNDGAIGGTGPFAYVSTAGTNAQLPRGYAATLVTLAAYNHGATDAYIKLYNKSSAVVVGTDSPVLVLRLPPNSEKVWDFGRYGIRFGSGFGYAITGADDPLDTTAIVAGQVRLAGMLM